MNHVKKHNDSEIHFYQTHPAFKGFVKVCGMKDSNNIEEIYNLSPDFMGFIFYAKSPRFVGNMDPHVLKKVGPGTKKIGVFVNEDVDDILTITYKYKLDGVQLHGKENIMQCYKLKEAGLIVIKAFPIVEACNFRVMHAYEHFCDYFLFDTKTDNYGGSGIKFDWSLLDEYHGATPFILSGGITAEDALDLMKIEHPKLAGIDINSKFEVEPGLKDEAKIRSYLSTLYKKKIV
jgi:phosphoribosylanthranilate isomerase